MQRRFAICLAGMAVLLSILCACGGYGGASKASPLNGTMEPPAPESSQTTIPPSPVTPPQPIATPEGTPHGETDAPPSPSPIDPVGQTETPEPWVGAYAVRTAAYVWDNGRTYLYYQIAGLGDTEKEERVNRELRDAAVGWFTDYMDDAISLESSVRDINDVGLYQVGKYLVASYWYDGPLWKAYTFNIKATIDLETGKRVLLDDLVDIGIDFIRRIREGNIAINLNSSEETQEDDDRALRASFRGTGYEELKALLEKCNLSNDDLRQCLLNGGNTYRNVGGFYLREGELVLFRSTVGNRFDIAFRLDDIEEFLKVPKW